MTHIDSSPYLFISINKNITVSCVYLEHIKTHTHFILNSL